MSVKQTINITCPICGSVHKKEVWSSVNTKFNPEQKERVLSGDIFFDECPECHAKTLLSIDFLYHNPDKKYMIMLSEQGNVKEELDRASKILSLAADEENDYKFRQARTINELSEKINIFDNNLDDKVIEFYKYVMKKTIKEDHKISNIGYSRFEVINGSNKIVYYSKEDKPVAQINVDEKIKDFLMSKQFETPMLMDKKYERYVIDEEWIKSLLHYFMIYVYD